MTYVYKLIYRCRLCDEVITASAWFQSRDDYHNYETILHECNEQYTGICDLLGFEELHEKVDEMRTIKLK